MATKRKLRTKRFIAENNKRLKAEAACKNFDFSLPEIKKITNNVPPSTLISGNNTVNLTVKDYLKNGQ